MTLTISAGKKGCLSNLNKHEFGQETTVNRLKLTNEMNTSDHFYHSFHGDPPPRPSLELVVQPEVNHSPVLLYLEVWMYWIMDIWRYGDLDTTRILITYSVSSAKVSWSSLKSLTCRSNAELQVDWFFSINLCSCRKPQCSGLPFVVVLFWSWWLSYNPHNLKPILHCLLFPGFYQFSQLRL